MAFTLTALASALQSSLSSFLCRAFLPSTIHTPTQLVLWITGVCCAPHPHLPPALSKINETALPKLLQFIGQWSKELYICKKKTKQKNPKSWVQHCVPHVFEAVFLRFSRERQSSGSASKLAFLSAMPLQG